MSSQEYQQSHVLKGLGAGLVGGLIASVVMNRFQAGLGKLTHGVERSHGAQSLQQGSPHRGIARKLQERGSDRERDDAAVRFANALSEGVFRHSLTEQEKKIAGTASHYGFGVVVAGLYGVAAELLPKVTKGIGLPFGTFIWLAADEGVVPALGLSKAATRYPLRTHAYSLAAHLVFGLTAEAMRRAALKIL